MFWPCETRTSTCRSFATISSGLYRFLAIAVLLDVKDIPQVGPLQWGWINGAYAGCDIDMWLTPLVSEPPNLVWDVDRPVFITAASVRFARTPPLQEPPTQPRHRGGLFSRR